MTAESEAGTNKAVADCLMRHSLVVETAESCTGGLIASHPAAMPGAGKVSDPGVAPGTQSFAWAFRSGCCTQTLTETTVFERSRNEIREAGADYALQGAAHCHPRFQS